MRERVARGDQLDARVAGEERVRAHAGGKHADNQRQKQENRRTRRERTTKAAVRALRVLRFDVRREALGFRDEAIPFRSTSKRGSPGWSWSSPSSTAAAPSPRPATAASAPCGAPRPG